MTRYAENTGVSSDKSRAEIVRTLTRYGATAFGYGWQKNSAVIMFEARDRRIKFTLPLPGRQSDSIRLRLTPTGMVRSDRARKEAYEQAVRQRWRALVLCIKAKLEAAEAGIVEFCDEFMAHVVLCDTSRAIHPGG